MHLYIVRFSDDSYQIVVRASNHESAREKAIEYIKKYHSWYSQYISNDLHISISDEDYIIE